MDEMPNDAPTPPPGWEMQIFEVVPRLLIGTKILPPAEYASIGVDAIVDLENWELCLGPTGTSRMHLPEFPAGGRRTRRQEGAGGRGLRRIARVVPLTGLPFSRCQNPPILPRDDH
jgi:hypothetical protein